MVHALTQEMGDAVPGLMEKKLLKLFLDACDSRNIVGLPELRIEYEEVETKSVKSEGLSELASLGGSSSV